MTRPLLAMLLLIAAPGYSQLPEDPAEIAHQLGQHIVVQGDFTQIRVVEGIPDGLRSTGHYVFWRDHGIFWETNAPIQRTLIYRADKTLVRDGAQFTEVKSARGRHFRRILLTLFSFDLEELAAEFELHWDIKEPGWTLELLPIKSSTRRFLSRITLAGHSEIQSLNVTHTSGEALKITFANSRSLPSLSSSACTEHFAYSAEQCLQFADEQSP